MWCCQTQESVEHQGFMVDLKSMWFNFYPDQVKGFLQHSEKQPHILLSLFFSWWETPQKDKEFLVTEVGLHGEACNALVQPGDDALVQPREVVGAKA